MLLAKIKNIKARKNFEKVEKIKKIDKFLFINLLNKTNNSVEHPKVFSFFLKKKRNTQKQKLQIDVFLIIEVEEFCVLMEFLEPFYEN